MITPSTGAPLTTAHRALALHQQARNNGLTLSLQQALTLAQKVDRMPDFGRVANGRKPTPRHPKEPEVVELLRQGVSTDEVSRRLRMGKAAVRRIRVAYRIPIPARQPLSLEEKWAQFVRPLPDGHMEWIGSRATSKARTPLLPYKGREYSAAGVAFQLRTGRAPSGYTRSACGFHQCVAPAHVDDAATRRRARTGLRAVLGLSARP